MVALSPPEHTASAVIDDAARWFVAQGDWSGRAIVPELKQRFGLTNLEAIETIRAANLLRREAHDASGR